MDVAQRCTGTTRTLSLGFAWPGQPQNAPAPTVQEAISGCCTASATSPQVTSARLPEMARSLPRSFVVGGDLPRVYLGGKEFSRISSGWRPLFDVCTGSVLGALLQVQSSTAKLTILQDGVCRCTVEVELPDDRWAASPHGAVDVCGTVQCVALRQGVEIPRAALQAACREEAVGGAPTSSSGDGRDKAHKRCSSVDSSLPVGLRD
uniref:Uncharacterized protein n=1 Tax=Alexandrium catenella TaxID=2925 RepID=A0A7S1R742_ALECA